MVKSINLHFDDDIFEKLKEVKNGQNWEDFIISCCLKKEGDD
jgi:predicted CopG family antitoxin